MGAVSAAPPGGATRPGRPAARRSRRLGVPPHHGSRQMPAGTEPGVDTPQLQSRLPRVGTTIFTVMSQLAAEHGAVNMGQGFPDFDVPPHLVQALSKAMAGGHNQYAPAHGLPALREAIADKTRDCSGHRPDPATEITVTSGGSEAILDAVMAVVHPGEEVIVLDPCYDCY